MEPLNPDLEGNLWRLHAFSAVCFTPFFAPVIVLFWRDNGLDLYDVFVLQGLFALAVVLLEVPTGLVADRLGKRTSLVLATLILGGGLCFYGLGASFAWFLAGEVVTAAGASFLSGADQALLYDTLRALGREKEFPRFAGRMLGIQLASVAVCSVVGGLVGAWSPRATLLLSGLGSIGGLLVARGLVEVVVPDATRSLRDGALAYRDLVVESARFVRKHRLVQWQIAFLAVLSGSGTWLLWLYQPYMEFCGLPVWSFGLVYAGLNLWAALSGTLVGRVDRALGREGSLLALGGLQIAPLPLMAAFPSPFTVFAALGHQSVRGFARPIVANRILGQTFADKRSTVLSIANLAGRLFFAVTAPFVGLASRHLDLQGAIWAQAAALTVLLALLWAAYRRIPAKYFAIKDSVVARQ